MLFLPQHFNTTTDKHLDVELNDDCWPLHLLDQVITFNLSHHPLKEKLVMSLPLSSILAAIIALYYITGSNGFSVQRGTQLRGHGTHYLTTSSFITQLSSTTPDMNMESIDLPFDKEDMDGPMKITSPLRFIGPYPSLSLRFPNLATQSQVERSVSGVSLDFVLDTAANTNTINAAVAAELSLEDVGEALPGYNAAGEMDGAPTFFLGDCTLDSSRKELFMQNLTASALPIASPAAAGLMSVAFLNCFEGGVRFDWGGVRSFEDSEPKESLITFYGSAEGIEHELESMTRVPIKVLEDVLLPTVQLRINGVDIPALLDTGSPISVINGAAANIANVETVQFDDGNKYDEKEKKSVFNPFQKLKENFKAAQSLAQATTRGEVLTVAGTQGQRIDLLRSRESVNMSLKEEEVDFPAANIFVGDLPGLAALGGLQGVDSPPAAILGMDVLRGRNFMHYMPSAVMF